MPAAAQLWRALALGAPPLLVTLLRLVKTHVGALRVAAARRGGGGRAAARGARGAAARARARGAEGRARERPLVEDAVCPV